MKLFFVSASRSVCACASPRTRSWIWFVAEGSTVCIARRSERYHYLSQAQCCLFFVMHVHVVMIIWGEGRGFTRTYLQTYGGWTPCPRAPTSLCNICVNQALLNCKASVISDKLSLDILRKPTDTPGFYSLDQVLDTLAAGQVVFVKQTRTMLYRIEK